eukprot:541817-Prorocentrum_minimum.AAC.3
MGSPHHYGYVLGTRPTRWYSTRSLAPGIPEYRSHWQPVIVPRMLQPPPLHVLYNLTYNSLQSVLRP